MKEYLEEQDKPEHHAAERQRLDLLRIFAGKEAPDWPRHIKWYHGWWAGSRGDLGCFMSEAARAELDLASQGGGDGHH